MIIYIMNFALKEADEQGADSDDPHDQRRRRSNEEGYSQGGSPLHGDTDRLLGLQHGVQANQDQVHGGHHRDRAGIFSLDANDHIFKLNFFQ